MLTRSSNVAGEFPCRGRNTSSLVAVSRASAARGHVLRSCSSMVHGAIPVTVHTPPAHFFSPCSSFSGAGRAGGGGAGYQRLGWRPQHVASNRHITAAAVQQQWCFSGLTTTLVSWGKLPCLFSVALPPNKHAVAGGPCAPAFHSRYSLLARSPALVYTLLLGGFSISPRPVPLCFKLRFALLFTASCASRHAMPLLAGAITF